MSIRWRVVTLFLTMWLLFAMPVSTVIADPMSFIDAPSAQPLLVAGLFSRSPRNAEDFKIDRDDVDDENVPQSVSKIMLEEIDLSASKDNVKKKINMLNEEQRLLYSVMVLEKSVNEGGFDMYLSTDAANLLPDAKKGLDLIGATQYLILVNKALKLFVDDEYALDNKFSRRTVLSKLPRPDLIRVLEPLDNQFFELERDNILQEKLTEFINKYPAQFFEK